MLENGKKYWKSQGILSVRKSGNPDIDSMLSVISHAFLFRHSHLYVGRILGQRDFMPLSTIRTKSLHAEDLNLQPAKMQALRRK